MQQRYGELMKCHMLPLLVAAAPPLVIAAGKRLLLTAGKRSILEERQTVNTTYGVR